MRLLRVLALTALAVLPAALAWSADLRERAGTIFGTLPATAENPANPTSPAKVELGRMLYYDARLSKNHDISCNSCHQLDRFGVDGEATSPGHKGQRGDRNSPTSLNAALHVAQFWDGRAADVEEQAKGPVLNPVEMALPDAASVEKTLRSIPGYAPLFAKAFPGDADPITFDHMALAIAAFERGLLTPAPFDAFLAGSEKALDEQQQRGLATFIDTGCVTCHNGPLLGGNSYQKLGLVHAYETEDTGRHKVSGSEADRFLFKVPSLRNVAKTGKLSDAQVADLVAFLGSLTGEVDADYVAQPELPASGPATPKPDPS
jgi:cytochrome c peroxidase